MSISLPLVGLLWAALHGSPPGAGVLLEDLTWVEAERVLKPDTVVVLPLGAESKEHGPHLKLKNDFLIAAYLSDRVRRESDVVIAPTVNYHFYPAFTEYPGSTSLRLETARDLVVDVCRGLSRFGPRRFYVLNTGVSTVRALAPAAEILAAEDRALGPRLRALLICDFEVAGAERAAVRPVHLDRVGAIGENRALVEGHAHPQPPLLDGDHSGRLGANS